VIKIRFTDFWQDSHSVESKFFAPLLERVFDTKVEIVTIKETLVDVEIFSVHPQQPSLSSKVLRKGLSVLSRQTGSKNKLIDPLSSRIHSNAKRRIWYTGENLRPPLTDGYDAYLTFDSNSYHEKNIYLPLWVLNINWFGQSGIHGFISETPTQEQLLSKRQIDSSYFLNRNGVCAFIGVMEETRRAALYNISKSLDTQIFGRSVNRQVIDKIQASKPFKFVLAFENSIHPGYVTEKLLEANRTEAFPLYWGPRKLDYFNSEAFINLSNFENLDSFNEEILRLNRDEEEMLYRLSQPLMIQPFDLEKVTRDLKNLLL
jgi:Glycosyltransferase family 10 (fucosyltransferase) C-term